MIALLLLQTLDFSKLDRTIAKEPAYAAEPLYALFVLDTEGKARHWAVLDKSGKDHYDVLYFDVDGDGDLTEKGERFTGTYDEEGAPAGLAMDIQVGNVLKHTDFRVAPIPKKDRKGIFFTIKWNGVDEVGGGQAPHGYDNTIWSRTAAGAPILWPNPHARLAFAIFGENELAVGKENHLYLMVGTPGSTPDALCYVDENFLTPEADLITATLIAKDSAGNEVKTPFAIKQHC
jgi:hypothetical protein